MLDPVNVILGSTVAVLVATEAPLPVQVTAMVLVAIVLRYLLRRDDSTHIQHEKRLNEMQAEISRLNSGEAEQRHLKHLLNNRITGIQAALALLIPAAEKCTCGQMSPFLPVLVRLSTSQEGESAA